ILIPPLAAMVFYKSGRHPLAGLAAGFAGAGAGFTANLFVAGTDSLLAGISTEAARFLDESFTVTPVDNWFFNIVSVFVLTIVGGLLTTRFIEPRLGKYTGDAVEEADSDDIQNEKKGVINEAVAGTIFLDIMAFIVYFLYIMLSN